MAFRNRYNQHVWVAIMCRDTGACGGEGGGWRTEGWWSLSPGEAKTAFWTTNQYAYFYAEAQDGRWWGDSVGPAVYVRNERFQGCYAIGTSTWRIVRMSQLNVGWPPSAPGTHTINLQA
ncbi:MAG TPA: DUF1036 domain-containing protein [Jiangellales bacterium]|nr:DUF1036 domain-containing protein [Jiangellales bacterium]